MVFICYVIKVNMDLEVLKIAADTDNNINIEKKTHISKLKNSLCGDEMQIELLIKNKVLIGFYFLYN